jgi:hypothetical protein
MSEAIAKREVNEEPTSLDDAAQSLQALERASQVAEPHNDNFKALRILERAAQLGVQDYGKLSEFILRHLVPRCCESSEQAQGAASRYRELLRDWIESLPEKNLRAVRDDVICDLKSRLTRSPNDLTLYCLSVIGFRNRDTIYSLRAVAKRDDEKGDLALRLFSGLGRNSKERAWIVRRVKERLHHRQNDELLFAAAILGGSEWIPLMSQPPSAERIFWLGFSRLLWLCDDAPGDGKLQEQVWTAITTLHKSLSDGWQQLLFTGGAIGRCHSSRALKEFVDGLMQISELGDMHVYRWCSQLESPQSRMQVLGWREIDRPEVANRLRRILERPSGHEGTFSTAAERLKRDVLQLLLCAGERSILDWANDAIATEHDIYLRHSIIEALAVLSFDKLPKEVVRLLTTPLDVDQSAGPPIELEHLAAARVAGCSQTLSSFELLLNAQMTSKGHPYVSPVNSGAALARHLFEGGDSRVLMLLIDVLRQRTGIGAVSIASKAAGLIARKFPLPTELVDALYDLAKDVAQPVYVRKEALESITEVAARTGHRESLQFLNEFGNASESELRDSAISGLIYALPDYEFFKLGASYWMERVPRLSPNDTESSRRVAAIYGQLAAREPTHHASRAAEAISEPTGWISAAVLWGFANTRRAARELPESMSAALARTILEHESIVYGNLGLIRGLALSAPRRFFQEDWHRVWEKWMPNSRKALVDAALEAWELIGGETVLQDRAVEIFERLRGDPVFAVRRSAARALAKIDPRALRQWCGDAIASGSINARRIAAYAAGWLPADSDATLDNDLLRHFLSDDERSVRESASRARNEARRRKWAVELIDLVRQPHADANERVLRCYAASRALANVGDDSDIEKLSEMLNEKEIAPNVHFWLKQTRKLLEEQWKKTTSEWPEPWLPWKGAIERLEGALISGSEEYVGTFTLWRREGFGQELTEWGGSVLLQSQSGGPKLMFSGGPRLTVRIPGRKEATAHITELGSSGTLLAGSGTYPTLGTDS